MIAMEKKGLCITCAYDKGCAFPRKFPVVQCEEFTTEEPKPEKAGRIKIGKRKTE